MSQFIINGGKKIGGSIDLQGSKNAALPILAATVITGGESIIHNCPKLSDVTCAVNILRHLGCLVYREGDALVVNSASVDKDYIPDDLMTDMRSSVLFLGALIGRTKKAIITAPGGCELGPRPIDIHISALKKLGVRLYAKNGSLNFETQSLIGNDIVLPLPSVGATENAMIAASCASGTTIIKNAAREPEIYNLAQYLNNAGAHIVFGDGGDISVSGTENFNNAQITVIPDRIVASTYMACAAVTRGELLINNLCAEHLLPINEYFIKSGCTVKTYENSLYICAPDKLKSTDNVRTHYYPGFPTDSAPMLLSMMSVANGTTVFTENIFQNRFRYTEELNRMGADILVYGKTAVVNGVPKLNGTKVCATDLRGGAALVIAGLCAEGKTRINKTCYILRGYENLCENLQKCGADIKEN
ncbi:MAG: UDP-N-acetylglucosamine 1-carboxyvinyltransferase [Oscillospiraceae bacterium]|nr:UDP-N-acetylglucosamine 1-carboxyvinyltransferase [Candidatus Equicaccousia limihippi]